MQQLKEQISHNLITYQREVDVKLRELYNQGLLSGQDIEQFKIDIQLTGKAVLQVFDSENNYPESVLRVYMENLFEKYRIEVESKIAAIEKKRLVYPLYPEDINQEDDPDQNQSTQQNLLYKLKEWMKENLQPKKYSFKRRKNG
jgi:hypothetical protein